MIVVLMGTNPYPFERLLRPVALWGRQNGELVRAQVGSTPCSDLGIESRQFVPHAELMGWLAEARVVVTHGGFGSIRDGLVAARPVIAAPRRSDLGECQDDQGELVDFLSEMGRVVKLLDCSELDEAMEIASRLRPASWNRTALPSAVAMAVSRMLD